MKKYDHIAEYGTVSENELSAIVSKLSGGNMLLMYTAGIVKCVEAGDIPDAEHLLEARIFNEDAEIRVLRTAMGKEFQWRLIDDKVFMAQLPEDGSYIGSYDKRVFFPEPDKDYEEHYLDIDTKADAPDGYTYTSTGGGKYILPIKNAEKIRIRSYIDYDDNGIANIIDFRIVKLLERGEK